VSLRFAELPRYYPGPKGIGRLIKDSTAASPALHALLEHLVDYAGLFPPASLSMREAAAEYATQRRGPYRWMLGRFVVPSARLDELAAAAQTVGEGGVGEPWGLSALVSADPAGDVSLIREFNRANTGRLCVESIELRAATVDAVEFALAQLDGSLECYVELPLDECPTALLEVVKRHGARAKARTGGVTPDAFPSAESLARFIAECARLGVPFKATAGLHHPLRGEHRLTYETGSGSATMFGFLNVFVAAALARAGADDAILIAVLQERDAGAFTVEAGSLRWRHYTLEASELATTRRDLALSFGSCSFREPVDDLRQIGFL
jgi:hypothetical protein